LLSQIYSHSGLDLLISMWVPVVIHRSFHRIETSEGPVLLPAYHEGLGRTRKKRPILN